MSEHLSYSTYVLVVGLPLTVIGGITGKNLFFPAEIPCAVSPMANPTPPQIW